VEEEILGVGAVEHRIKVILEERLHKAALGQGFHKKLMPPDSPMVENKSKGREAIHKLRQVVEFVGKDMLAVLEEATDIHGMQPRVVLVLLVEGSFVGPHILGEEVLGNQMELRAFVSMLLDIPFGQPQLGGAMAVT
jgi:hypothetical protein